MRYGLTLVVLAAGSACGGESTFTPGDGGSGGSGGSGGGGGVGGASMAGGGGTGQAGAGATSGASGMTGACDTPPEFSLGECPQMVYHDPETGECRPGALHKCLGSPNRFSSIAECLWVCPGSRPATDACDAPTDCIVGSTGCCGLCPDAPFDTAKGLNAVRALAGDYRPCGNVACEPCAEVPPASQTSQYYLATCANHQCGVVDLRTTASTACEINDDCFLRNGIECCAACTPGDVVALSSTDYLVNRCVDIGCPECLGEIPPELSPRCIAGRCAVVEEAPTGS